ncbi:hypothetical protein EQP59_08690 [Ornithobacterium rhinotracheale]|uniref:Rieske domain-containing protein n=1 Tax=Ornithobacterium rhinotracheale TaxID=28251 RepID=A0A410JTN6_ORNRH|nr:hypothetical protein [Ornithobacterium rhinotracheale]QAR31411.1 hypothetical protein EQP59_08690 [Ornithobacterium rhinotracheale]
MYKFKILNKNLLKQIIVSFIMICVLSCSSDQGRSNCMPRSYVNARYSLNTPQLIPLQSPMGYVVLNPDGTNGGRGLIIVNTGARFLAYDRNAPQICPMAKSTLEVVDDIKVVCPENGAEWMLNTGMPINSATNGVPLYQYAVQQERNFIVIFN